MDTPLTSTGATDIVVERLTGPPAQTLGALLTESEAAGVAFVRRLVTEWADGTNRFDRPGEALFVAVAAGEIVGVCGLNVDPYSSLPGIGRVRHLYVRIVFRRRGVGRRLVEAVVAAARDSFDRVRLRTHNPDAAGLDERAGFVRRTDEPDYTHAMALRD